MKAKAAAWLAAAVLASSAAPAQERFAFATLENGASMGFALVRTGHEGSSETMGAAALPRSNSVSRVLWDRESGAYFGYRVEVERKGGPRPFRVSFKALDRAAVERELKQRAGCPSCPPPAPLGSGPRFPAPQLLAEGEALTLELLTNPETGERILDVVRVSARPLAPVAMQTGVARALEGQQSVRRAAVHVARGRYSAAADEYRKALEVQPNDATVHNKLGICYQQLGNGAMARREYDRALALDPGYGEVWNNIGTLEQARKRFKAAVRAYKKAIETKPGLATPWKNLGNAYLALGQAEEAFEAYQEAFRLDPTVLESQGPGIPAAGIDVATQSYYLAKLLAANGQTDSAFEFLRRAKEAGFRDFDSVRSDPAFRAVVADPRFRELAPAK
ncbi:MAG TPA: tetratricopeptide repeat protein [Vicinamibacteria bacterium]|nr:tetratricopeptide repeat protein [Vicinamibacteria bacterium]